MSTVTVSEQFPVPVHVAQARWEDTNCWSAWVDGLEHIAEVSAGWPAAGSQVRWESGPAGRGEVTERVTEREALTGLTTEVSDDTLQGTQRVSFEPVAKDTVLVTLSLEYRVRRRSLATPVIDLLFIRGAMRSSLRATLERFGAELTAPRPGRRD